MSKKRLQSQVSASHAVAGELERQRSEGGTVGELDAYQRRRALAQRARLDLHMNGTVSHLWPKSANGGTNFVNRDTALTSFVSRTLTVSGSTRATTWDRFQGRVVKKVHLSWEVVVRDARSRRAARLLARSLRWSMQQMVRVPKASVGRLCRP